MPAEDAKLPRVQELVEELIPGLTFKRMAQAKVHLALKLEDMYNEFPMYHMKVRIDFRFVRS